MRLLGANSSPFVGGEGVLAAKANYFLGNDPAFWRTNVPTFGKVRYRDAYPGIDLVYYGNEGTLEYDFVVAPGADPRQIVMEFEGADELGIQDDGDLAVRMGGQEVRWKKPIVYQEVNGRRREIAGRFRIQQAYVQATNLPSAARSTLPATDRKSVERVAFDLAAYDPGLSLVIDPILVFSTYLGGNGADGAKTVAADAQGNVFLAGFTESVDFPTRSPLIATAPGGSIGNLSTDIFVSKFSPAGELLFSTYLGGSGDEWGDDTRIAVSDTGDCYVAGTTASLNFPLVKPLQPSYGGGEFDAFIAQLQADGTALSFSTYLGGASWDSARGIALGSGNDIFLVGYTRSIGFPTTNAFQAQLSPPNNGNQLSDGFVTKLEAGGKRILYSTYIGASSTGDMATGVAVDRDGNAYVAALVSDFALNRRQYSVVKIRPDGRSRVFDRRWPTAMAQEYMFEPYIALVASNSVAVAGSVAVPYLQAVNQPNPSISLGPGFIETYIALFNATNGAYQSGVYLGGNGSDWVSGLRVDSANDIVVAGYTSGSGVQASGFPVTDPVSSGPDPGKTIDAFVAKFRPPNLSMTQSTLLGGPGDDSVGGMAIDPSGRILVAGYTTGQFPTMQAYQPSFGDGVYDAFLLSLSWREAKVRIARSGERVILSWPIEAADYVLEAAASITAGVWETVTNAPTLTAFDRTVQVSPTGPTQFFRLRKP